MRACMQMMYASRSFTPHRTIETPGPQPLTRVAPVPIRYLASDPGSRYFAFRSALTTHPDPVAAASSFFAFLIRRAILRPQGDKDMRRFLDRAVTEYLAINDNVDTTGLLAQWVDRIWDFNCSSCS